MRLASHRGAGDWTPLRLGRIGRFLPGAGFPHEFQGVEDAEVPFFKVGDTNLPGNERELRAAPNTVSRATARQLGARICPAGAIAFPKVGATLLGNKRRLTVRECIFDNNMMALIPRAEHDARFLLYALGDLDFGQLSNPGPVPSINAGDLKDVFVPIPACDTQRAVAAFLDRKTAAIDALIAKKERLIELLQEKRQALITQAVTKGLDPNVPMKESGVEWLGPIPAHWTLRRLKHLGQIRSGIAKGRDVAGKPTIVRPYVRVANVQNGWLNLEEIATIEVTRGEARRYVLRQGDVLMNEGGDFDKLGRGYVWEGQITDCIHQNHVFAVRPWRGVNPYWVNLATQASYLRHFFILRSKQSTNLASISSTNLGEAPIPMPSETEVEAILRRLRERLGKLDHLASKVARHIAKLREYRQALITAAVTGKIDLSSEAA